MNFVSEDRTNGHFSEHRTNGHLSEYQTNGHFSEHQTSGHLSEYQINGYLIGDLAGEAAAHLAACRLCESRVTEAAAPIEAFKAVTVAWSERRSATLPLHQSMARSAMFHPRAAWAAALSVALAVGVAIPFAAHQQRQEIAHTQAQSQAAIADTTAIADVSNGSGSARIVSGDIARDNQMLKAIDRELDATVESPESLGLQPVGATTKHKAEPLRSVQD